MPVGFRPSPVRSEHRREKGPQWHVRAHFCANRLEVEFFARDGPNPVPDEDIIVTGTTTLISFKE